MNDKRPYRQVCESVYPPSADAPHDGPGWSGPLTCVLSADPTHEVHWNSGIHWTGACRGHYPACTHRDDFAACDACIERRRGGPLFCADLDNCAGPGCMDHIAPDANDPAMREAIPAHLHDATCTHDPCHCRFGDLSTSHNDQWCSLCGINADPPCPLCPHYEPAGNDPPPFTVCENHPNHPCSCTDEDRQRARAIRDALSLSQPDANDQS